MAEPMPSGHIPGWLCSVAKSNMQIMRNGRSVLFMGLFTLHSLAIAQVAPSAQTNASVTTFRVESSLVLLDVFTLNEKTGLPENTLTKDDFRVFDDRHEVILANFGSGAHYDNRAVTLWLVALCNEIIPPVASGWVGSGNFAGKESLFRPALNALDSHDRVAVAHWCDNGQESIDLAPTNDTDKAITMLQHNLKRMTYPWTGANYREGELTLQALFRSLIRDAHRTQPHPLPVVVVLNADQTGMPAPEVDKLTDDFLETSGVIFGIKNKNTQSSADYSNGEEGSIFHHMVEQTGGQYYSVLSKDYDAALTSIILQLHFRYELGFVPSKIDGKRHMLKVELTDAAKKKYKKVRLRYREEYIPTLQEPDWIR